LATVRLSCRDWFKQSKAKVRHVPVFPSSTLRFASHSAHLVHSPRQRFPVQPINQINYRLLQTVPLVLLFYRSPLEPQTNKGESSVLQAYCLFALLLDDGKRNQYRPSPSRNRYNRRILRTEDGRFGSNLLTGLACSRATKLARHDLFGSSGTQQP